MKGLFPGYFALVMATGIIAIAAEQQNLHWLADVLFAIAVAAYVVLAVLLVGRLVRYPGRSSTTSPATPRASPS